MNNIQATKYEAVSSKIIRNEGIQFFWDMALS